MTRAAPSAGDEAAQDWAQWADWIAPLRTSAEGVWRDLVVFAEAIAAAARHPANAEIIIWSGAAAALVCTIAVVWRRRRHLVLERAQEQARQEAASAAETAELERAERERIAQEQAAQLARQRAQEEERAALFAHISRTAADQQAQLQARLDAQVAELRGRLSALSEVETGRQSETTQAINTRLSQVVADVARQMADTRADVQRHVAELRASVGDGLHATREGVQSGVTQALSDTQARLSALSERLAVIDQTQEHITDLGQQMVALQGILADKQARGAFGQGRMEAIIADALPPSAFSLQATLSNGKRPDCLIRMPNTPAGLVIDAKFPLEGFEALRRAATAADRKQAAAQVRSALGTHVADIARKYLIPGETQDTALMFVPSEAIYAELHETFPDVIQMAHRARIFIVSPNMLMLAVQTMQAILKDVKMREAAGQIQREVAALLKDVTAMTARVADLERHHAQSGAALEKLTRVARRIGQRGEKIDAIGLEDPAAGVDAALEAGDADGADALCAQPRVKAA